jgi:hypothetical protein
LCREGEERGIFPAGVVESSRRGWMEQGEIAGSKVTYGEVVPLDVNLAAVCEKDATSVLGSIEGDHLTRRDDRDPDVGGGQSEFLGEPS